MGTVWVFSLIYFVCELGEKVTHQFNVFHEELCNCDWLLFPIEIKRIYLLVLFGAEQPAVIQGYAQTTCTRTTFKKVRIMVFLGRFGQKIDIGEIDFPSPVELDFNRIMNHLKDIKIGDFLYLSNWQSFLVIKFNWYGKKLKIWLAFCPQILKY